MLQEIRNNNPGNIRYSIYNNWIGQTGFDYRGFCIFDTLENGIRAMIKLVLNYISQGFNTINLIVGKYAPPNENDTSVYASNVSGWSLYPINKTISINDESILTEVIKAMIRMETSTIINSNLISLQYNNLINNISPVPTENFALKNSLVPFVVVSSLLYLTFKS